MLHIKTNTDIFDFINEGNSEAIAHGVNTLGVMGGFAGIIARDFSEQCDGYQELCEINKTHHLTILDGGMAIEAVKANNPVIYHLVTQINPGADARIEFIKESLTSAIEMAKKRGHTSIAIPAIGTGIGGLDYDETVAELTEHFKEEDFSIYLCVR